MSFKGIPTVVSYSDGEGSEAGVGIAIWKSGEPTEAGYIKVPESIRALWSRQREFGGDLYGIYEIEAVGPALVVATWPEKLRNCLWLHFIDNESALAAVIKGGSSVHSADVIAAYVAEQCASLGCWSWFDRVDTHANPVDGLSRGRMEGDWVLVKLQFPRALKEALVAYLEEPTPLMKVATSPTAST